jgi:ribonuclease BN (tRNA processing enzyme)
LEILHRGINAPIKIVYSGDCRPTVNLIRGGKFCDVLIHEATFEDDLIEDAKLKKHATISEALNVSTRMMVKGITILTHFSQRYSSLSQDINDTNGADSTEECDFEDKQSLRTPHNYALASDFFSLSLPCQLTNMSETSKEIARLYQYIDDNHVL